MRIIRLYWENVNSLAGAYEIDFSAPEFRANGLFAITGPMGSGKTSILDAVTIALFGKTARSSPYERKHDREDDCMFMTKGRARCEAKIVFESKGRLYCSRWSRGTTKTGRLKPPEVELGTFDVMEDLETKSIRILAEKKTEWDAAVEAALGMTYDGSSSKGQRLRARRLPTRGGASTKSKCLKRPSAWSSKTARRILRGA